MSANINDTTPLFTVQLIEEAYGNITRRMPISGTCTFIIEPCCLC